MGSGSTRLRTKVIALLASLVALWPFAAWVTVRDGFNLLWVQTLDSRVAEPGEPLVTELQTERRLATTYLGQRGQRQRDELTAQWRRTGQVTDTFRTSVHGWQAELATSDLGRLDDARIAADSATLVDLYQVRELMSEQDALISGVLAAGRVTANRAEVRQEAGLGPEHVAIVALCQRVQSVAEVSARLDLPVGAVRVLLGDLVERDLVRVQEPRGSGAVSDVSVFEAVINGLRAL